jgi:acyl-CoA synthetase (AMP-forming)/AMP-acid ligase II
MEPDPAALLAALPRRLSDLPARHAARPGVALDGPEGALCWAALAEATERAAEALAARGVRPGDRVLVAAENGLPFALALLGCWRLDAWAIPANARLTEAELAAIAAHATPRLVLAGAAAAGFAARVGAEPERDGPLAGLAATPPLDATPEPTDPDTARQVAALIYTSGTTGTPKGVMLSHQAIALMAAVSAALRGFSPEDRLHGVLPMSHVFGLSNMFAAALTAGARLSLTPRFDPAALASALGEGVSFVTALPPNDLSSPRTRRHLPRFRAALAPDPARGDWAAWEGLLGDADEAEGHAATLCVPPRGGFGTVCQSLVALGAGGELVWRFAAPPGGAWREVA